MWCENTDGRIPVHCSSCLQVSLIQNRKNLSDVTTICHASDQMEDFQANINSGSFTHLKNTLRMLKQHMSCIHFGKPKSDSQAKSDIPSVENVSVLAASQSGLEYCEQAVSNIGTQNSSAEPSEALPAATQDSALLGQEHPPTINRTDNGMPVSALRMNHRLNAIVLELLFDLFNT